MVAYLKRSGTGITIEELAKQIASPDVKGTYDGLAFRASCPGPTIRLSMPIRPMTPP